MDNDIGRKGIAENQTIDATAQKTSFIQAEMPSISDCRKIA